MIPQYNDLLYFMAIAEAKNLSRASERLGVVQPTLSQSIRRLEDTVGVPLFIRQKTGVQLTRAGEVLVLRAGELMNSWQFLANEVKEAELLPKGHFVIGAHPAVAAYTLDKILPALLEKNELIEVSLVHGLSREILEAVVSSKVDFGFVINARRHPDLVIKKLSEDKMGFWARDGAGKQKILICDPSLTQTQELLKKSKFDFSRQIASSSLEVVAELVSAGTGIGILPQRVALKQGLKALQPQLFVQDELFLCYRKERQKSIASKALLDAILQAKL